MQWKRRNNWNLYYTYFVAHTWLGSAWHGTRLATKQCMSLVCSTTCNDTASVCAIMFLDRTKCNVFGCVSWMMVVRVRTRSLIWKATADFGVFSKSLNHRKMEWIFVEHLIVCTCIQCLLLLLLCGIGQYAWYHASYYESQTQTITHECAIIDTFHCCACTLHFITN